MTHDEPKNEALIGGSELNAGLCTLEVTTGITLSLARYNELLSAEHRVVSGPWEPLNTTHQRNGHPNEKETDSFVVGHATERIGCYECLFLTRSQAVAVANALNKVAAQVHNEKLTGSALLRSPS